MPLELLKIYRLKERNIADTGTGTDCFNGNGSGNGSAW